jgi:tRNA(Arg) A34 adenosine deaminase TadA
MNLSKIKEYIMITLCWLNDQPSPVGCSLLSPKGEFILFHNEGKKHCEQIICEQFASLEEYTIFLTLEPCFSCAFLLIRKRISAIFFGAYNTEHGALGGKVNILELCTQKYKIEYWGGILRKECEQSIKKFFLNKRKKTAEFVTI